MDPTEYSRIVDYKLKRKYPENFSKVQKHILRRKASGYVIVGEELYCWRHKDKPDSKKTKVVVGVEEAKRIFLECHQQPTGSHIGQTKTRRAIGSNFFWQGMTVDVKKWISECETCRNGLTYVKKPNKLTTIEVAQPFDLVVMDIIGNLPLTSKGHQYICVLIDYLTKWPQAYPLHTETAAEVTRCLKKFVYQFEAPQLILTNQREEFINNLKWTSCNIVNIERSPDPLKYPQSDCLVKQMKGTIESAICKVVKEHQDTWDDYLDEAMFGIRTKKDAKTNLSPFFLLFGREPRLPSQIPEECKVKQNVEVALEQEEPAQDVKVIEEIFATVQENMNGQHFDYL